MTNDTERLDTHRGRVRIPSGPASRPNSAPAYYLGHPADRWITVMLPRCRPWPGAGARA